MSLAQLLESKFRGDIRFRGQAYLQAERVAVTRVTADHLHAVVRDGEEYQTQLSRETGKLRMFCTCTTSGREHACKHLWATILAVDAGSYLTGLPKLDDCPPFVADQPMLSTSPIFSMDDDPDEVGGDVFRPSTETVRVRQREALRQMPEWQRRLEAIHHELIPKATSSVSQHRERQIFYEIDVDESKAAGQVVIQTSQRQLCANGLWGSLKPLKLRPGKLDDIELEVDRKILAYLSGGTPERTNWHAQQAEFQSATFRYRLPPELCELLFPMMCATERVRYAGSEERKQPSLKWDEGQPWSLTVKVSEDKKSKQWQLTPELRRDGEAKTLEDVRLIVPGGLVLTEDWISRLEDFGAFSWVKLLNGSESLTVPLKEGKRPHQPAVEHAGPAATRPAGETTSQGSRGHADTMFAAQGSTHSRLETRATFGRTGIRVPRQSCAREPVSMGACAAGARSVHRSRPLDRIVVLDAPQRTRFSPSSWRPCRRC